MWRRSTPLHAHCQTKGRHRLVLGGSHSQAPLATTRDTHTAKLLNSRQETHDSIAESAYNCSKGACSAKEELKFTQVLTQGVASPNDGFSLSEACLYTTSRILCMWDKYTKLAHREVHKNEYKLEPLWAQIKGEFKGGFWAPTLHRSHSCISRIHTYPHALASSS